MGHTGGLINPRPWRGRCRAGYSNTGGPPLPGKRAPGQKIVQDSFFSINPSFIIFLIKEVSSFSILLFPLTQEAIQKYVKNIVLGDVFQLAVQSSNCCGRMENTVNAVASTLNAYNYRVENKKTPQLCCRSISKMSSAKQEQVPCDFDHNSCRAVPSRCTFYNFPCVTILLS